MTTWWYDTVWYRMIRPRIIRPPIRPSPKHPKDQEVTFLFPMNTLLVGQIFATSHSLQESWWTPDELQADFWWSPSGSVAQFCIDLLTVESWQCSFVVLTSGLCAITAAPPFGSWFMSGILNSAAPRWHYKTLLLVYHYVRDHLSKFYYTSGSYITTVIWANLFLIMGHLLRWSAYFWVSVSFRLE